MDYLFDNQLLVGRIGGVRYERENKTESYVVIPPAFIITDSDGAAWTLGSQYVDHGGGEYEFNVLRNDIDTGETAKRIEYRQGVVRIFGWYGWKTFSRNRRHFI
jgi:hypothetical protein